MALLLAPYLRKFGGYTVPDFLGERFGSATLRPLAVAGGVPLLVPRACRGAGRSGCHRYAHLCHRSRDRHRRRRRHASALHTSSAACARLAHGGSRNTPYCLPARLRRSAVLVWQHGAASSVLEATALFDALARLKLDTFAAPDRVNRVALVFFSRRRDGGAAASRDARLHRPLDRGGAQLVSVRRAARRSGVYRGPSLFGIAGRGGHRDRRCPVGGADGPDRDRCDRGLA